MHPTATVRKNALMHAASKPKSVVTCSNGELDTVAEKCGKRLTRLKIFAGYIDPANSGAETVH